jgi:aldose 1-epimerase
MPLVTHKRAVPWLRRHVPSWFLTPRLWSLVLAAYGLISLIVAVALISRMHVKQYLSAALYVLPVLGQAAGSNSSPGSTADPFQVYNITAENITASFIPYGARLVSLLVPDNTGTIQDVAVGYDDPTEYLHDTETNHTYFGAVVGRYANRIKNGTFTIDGTVYHVPENEYNGTATLHGGFVGYDARNWTVTAVSKSSITFTLLDAGLEDFPGNVITHATYTVDTDVTAANPKGLPQLTTKLVSLSLTEKTPIMLANHIYWNLNVFREPTVLDDTLQMPLAQRYVGADGNLIPNGTIFNVASSDHQVMDFTTGKAIGQDLQYADGVCGSDCTGYDTCFILDRNPYYPQDSVVPVLHLASPATGISLDVATNQRALQIYTCNGQNGTIPVKPSQAQRNQAAGKGGVDYVNLHGCIVIETEGWIDAINQPEWGQDQIFSPASLPTVNYATYQFGTFN